MINLKPEINRFIDIIKDNNELTAEEAEFLILCIFVKFNLKKQLNFYLNGDKENNYKKIDLAVKRIKGDKFSLTAHGINKTIDGKFNIEQKQQIVGLLADFCTFLLNELNIDVFITSGTLLGLVREKKFLSHDDDFDLSYISRFSAKEKIISERKVILDTVNKSENFKAQERTGGRMCIIVKYNDLKFNFDLFTGYKNGTFFNEFPLRPNKINFKDIYPTIKTLFYDVLIPVPNKPENLLEVNYGKNWRTPDPAFKFKYSEFHDYYRFLLSNKINDD